MEKVEARQASITVFLALSFGLICALLMTMLEGVQTECNRLRVQLSLNTALESLFGGYHRGLWEDYRLLAVEADTNERMLRVINTYFMQNSSGEEQAEQADNSELLLTLEEKEQLTQEAYAEGEMLAYMKQSIPKLLLFGGNHLSPEALGSELLGQREQLKGNESLYMAVRGADEAVPVLEALEQKFERLGRHGQDSENAYREAAAALQSEDAAAFDKAVERFCRAQQAVEAAVDDCMEGIKEVNEAHEELQDRIRRAAPDNQEQLAHLRAREGQYRLYVQQVEGRIPELREWQRQAKAAKSRAAEIQASLAEAIATAAEMRETDATILPDGTIIEEVAEATEDFWPDFVEVWGELERPHCEIASNHCDLQKRDALSRVLAMADMSLLELLWPKERERPSEAHIYERSPAYPTRSEANLAEKVLLGEYALRYFGSFQANEAQRFIPPSGNRHMEAEYLIAGELSDRDNIAAVLRRMWVLRVLANLSYLLRDTEKQAEARAFAAQTLCFTMNPIFVEIMAMLVLSAWAVGQAVLDLRALLRGEKVPLLHTKESWDLGLEGLLRLGDMPTASAESGKKAKTKGLSYRDYLRIFLMVEGFSGQNEINCRMLSRIEANIRSGEKRREARFLLSNCVHGLQVRALTVHRHRLWSFGLVQQLAGQQPTLDYQLETSSYYAYAPRKGRQAER